MVTNWLGEYRDIIEKMVKFGNSYASAHQQEKYYGADIEFSPQQIQTIEYLLENEEMRLNMSAVAARLGMTNSTFSKNIKKLTDRGLLEKYQTEGNRKNIIVLVSEKGRQVYNDYNVYVQELLFNDIFRELENIPPEHLKSFGRALEIWADVYDKPAVKKDGLVPLVKVKNS